MLFCKLLLTPRTSLSQVTVPTASSDLMVQLGPISALMLAQEITDTNAALFDAANGFSGCIPSIHDVLVRRGLMAGRWCLDRNMDLSPGQEHEIDRVLHTYPHLHDDKFIREHLDDRLR